MQLSLRQDIHFNVFCLTDIFIGDYFELPSAGFDWTGRHINSSKPLIFPVFGRTGVLSGD